MKGKLLIAVAAACVVGGPSLAYSQAPASGTVTAVDPTSWRVNGTEATTLTIVKGGSVTFAYPSGKSIHSVQFTSGPTVSCDAGVARDGSPRKAPWSGDCTFTEAGTYNFVCAVHPTMTGAVTVIEAATPTPTATATATSTPAATVTVPAATPTPTPTAGTPSAPAALKLTVASRQKGSRVRGSVSVQPAASRLEVTVRAKLGKTTTRVGHWTRTAAKAGPQTFAIRLTAKARRALRAKKRLTLSVVVALKPPGAKPLTRTATVHLRG